MTEVEGSWSAINTLCTLAWLLVYYPPLTNRGEVVARPLAPFISPAAEKKIMRFQIGTLIKYVSDGYLYFLLIFFIY